MWLLVDLGALTSAFRSASVLQAVSGIVGGLLIWILFEYCAHRYIFHLELRSAVGKHLIFLIHGNHHQDPKDPLRSIMPLTVSLPLGCLIWFACRFSGLHEYWAVFSGIAMGYTIYDSVHWACHQRASRNWVTRLLRKHHLLHHYAHKHGNYATTAPFLDRLFNTRIRPGR